jgi:hypothetical protein
MSERQAWRDIAYVERMGGGGLSPLGSGQVDKEWAVNKLWAELEVVKSEALRAWGRSQRGKRKRVSKTVTGEDGGKTEETEERETSPGDPRFLTVATGCIHDQAQLAGLLADAAAGRVNVSVDVHGDAETIAVIEVASRDQARELEGRRFCRLAGPGEGGGSTVVDAAAAVVEVQPGDG